MEDEKVIAYLARKICELEQALKWSQSDCKYYYDLSQRHQNTRDEEKPCQTMDLN